MNLKYYLELTKPRLATLALLMTAFGYFLAASPMMTPQGGLHFWWALLGTALIGASCGALNQYIERDLDRLMARTAKRPLPSGKLEPWKALVFGTLTGLAGFLMLYFLTNPLTAWLGALTLFFYIGPYTYSKTKSSISTILGAVPGALPPVMGWTAAGGSLNNQALALFLILFVWQVPHFFSIAWIYKKDYAKAKMPMLPVVDEYYQMTSRQSLIYSLCLIPVTLMPTMMNLSGAWYFLGALIMGLIFLHAVFKLYLNKTLLEARRVFRFSIIYLPLLLMLMLWDKVA